MIAIKIFVMFICAVLFWWGGYSWHNARRFIMPVILTVSALLLTHFDWWTLTMLATIGVFCLGYGDKSPLRHIFGPGWGRGVWGLLAGLTLSLGLFLTGQVAVGWFVIYLGMSFTLENALKNINQKIGDPLIGIGFASILIVIRG